MQLIFALADAGHGALTICKILNAQLDKHPTFDRRKNPDKPTEWSPKAVGRVLRDRSVIGEWQPYLLIDGKRVAVIGTGSSGVQLVPAIVDRKVEREIRAAGSRVDPVGKQADRIRTAGNHEAGRHGTGISNGLGDRRPDRAAVDH